MTRVHSLLFFLILLVVEQAHAQKVSADTMKIQTSVQDTTKRSASAGVDTVINYSAKDSIIYSLRTRYMNLFGKSEMQYQTTGLKAERVNVNWDNATLIAHGVPDTAKADSVIGKPIMRDGGEEYKGDQVKYNFRTRKGKITIGNTQMDNGYYVGDQIKKVDPDVLCVADGIYTTCDLKNPHFYFGSPKMKVFVRDKVVAEPIYLYVADVPVFALPFGVFPAHGGRSSGLIAPAYGNDNRFGWYLSHLGYYWAASDYWDLATIFDLYSRGRWQNQTNIRYALRYKFGGSITARITSSPEGEPSDPGYSKTREYYVNITHGQQITPSSNLSVNFTFMDGNFFKNNSFNLSEILQQNMYSYAAYSKSWESSNRWLSINLSRDQNLVTDETGEVLPSIAFTQGTVFPFRKKTKTRGLSTMPEADLSFVELLGFNYSANFNNTLHKSPSTISAKLDTTQVGLSSMNDFTNTHTQALSQSFSLSISPKLGYFTVSPSFSMSDTRTWTQTTTPAIDTGDSLRVYNSTRDRIINGNLNTGVNVSTRFFGMFQPNMFGVTAFRQTVTPTFGLFYNKQIYGDNMQKYSMTGSFGVGNNFEMKYQKNDSAKTEDKIQLLNISGGVSYNFAADSMNFTDVNINYRTDIGQYLGISGSANYNLYAFDPSANNGHGARVNKFLLKEQGRFGDLTAFSLSLSTSFKGDKKQKPSEAGIPDKVKQEQAAASGEGSTQPSQKKIYYSIYDREDADFSIPWNVTLGYNFSQSQPDPNYYSRTSQLSASLSFNLTEKWQISTSGWYNFVAKQHYFSSVSVTRDLHCWTMSFSWFPMGTLEGYRFELKVKAPQLQDLKVTKQNSNRGTFQ
ncbi:MAG: putative LPS assembly protein LptD [Ignavibacteriales bacterium]|nr:putative LPS assembly protein LptD [Ignavibacteriales bacterium]